MLLRFFTYILLITFSCSAYAQEDRWIGNAVDFSHGDLTVDPTGHYLQHADSTPFLYLGDTAWELISRLTEPEVNMYMENRREKGFTVIQTVILDELDGIYATTACGHTQLIDGDPMKPNEAYFAWVDKVLQIAESKGLYIALLPTWGDKVDKKWGKGPEIFTVESARFYGEYLGERYRNTPNLIWVIGGDRSGEDKNYEIWDAMAKGIKSEDQRHLMTYHPQGEASSSFWFHNAEWLDFNMIQTGHAQCDYAIYHRLLLPDMLKTPKKPVMDSEPRYENIPMNFNAENGRFDDCDVRNTLYQSVFSGGFGYTYGCNDIWQMYSDRREPQVSANTPWNVALDMEGACDLIHFRRLWERFDFTVGKPISTIINDEMLYDNDYPVAYGNKDYVLIYFPNGNPLKLGISEWNKENANLSWMNPRTGEITQYKQLNRKELNKFSVSAPNNGRANDWILIIE